MQVGRLFIAGLLAFGLVAGLVIATVPSLRALPVPPFIWPVVVALVVDLALLPLARQGRIAPLTMNERAVGVVGAGAIITLLLALLGP